MLRFISSVVIEQRLHVLDNLPTNIVLGIDAWQKLPIMVTMKRKSIFKGFEEI
jgi:hypothetical protein